MTVQCQDFPELPSGFYAGETKTNDSRERPPTHNMHKRPLHPMACTDMVIASAKGTSASWSTQSSSNSFN